MDSQIKVVFAVYNKSYTRELVAGLDKNNELDCREINFKEYPGATIKVSLQGTTNGTLEIETCESAEFLIVNAGQTENFYSYDSEENLPLVPGEYMLRIKCDEQVWEGLYTIAPNSISGKSLMRLRQELEEAASGLALDFYRKRYGNDFTKLSAIRSYREVISLLKEFERPIRGALDQLVRDPQTKVETNYKVNHKIKRLDSKSQRWLATKGSSKNSNVHYPNLVYQRTREYSVDTKENRWVRSMINYILHALRKIEQTYDSLIENNHQQLMDTQKAINDCEASLRNIDQKRERFLSLRTRKLKNEQVYLKKQEKEISERIVKITGFHRKARLMTVLFTKYDQALAEQCIRLEPMTGRPTKKLLNDSRYATLYRFYRRLKNTQTNEFGASSTGLGFKPTSLLYEYYIFINVIRILQDLGYSWSSGWLADDNSQEIINTLPAETKLEFVKEDHYLEVYYDTSFEAKSDLSQNHFTANKHDRPDILIAQYNLNGAIQKAFVIEVKYRRGRYLYDRRGDTNVIEQVNDYLYIRYYDKNKSKPIPIMEKVLIAYPQDSSIAQGFQADQYNQITLVQVQPDEEANHVFGYESLKKCIAEQLGFK